ncbi:MAG: hypothetical protein IKP06_03360 [Elusimicrobiaceae bacterium]|nr:hypothetical protein [Elusimicrobiaceae bacterium]
MDLKKLKENKYIKDLQDGFQDIQTVAQEGNVKLFMKQFITVVVILLIWHQLSGMCAKKIRKYKDQVAAVEIAQTSAQDYEANKKKLVDLEPRFPDVESKDDWLLMQILSIFKEVGVTPEVSSSQAEDSSNAAYLVTSLPVSVSMEFNQFADLLASIESRDEFLAISSLGIEKESDMARLGTSKISLKFNTAFPKEKIAKKLFKDYDKLVSPDKVKATSSGKSKKKGGK